MKNRTSSDLAEIRENPRCFTWGVIQTIQDIKGYTIIEYTDPTKGDAHFFHIYVDGANCHRGFKTFDGALLGCIAYKRNGLASFSHAALYAAKILNVTEDVY